MPAPVGMPPGQQLEVEFTSGVWTDVSTGTDVELLFAQLQIHYGRTSPFAQPGTKIDVTAGAIGDAANLVAWQRVGKDGRAIGCRVDDQAEVACGAAGREKNNCLFLTISGYIREKD